MEKQLSRCFAVHCPSVSWGKAPSSRSLRRHSLRHIGRQTLWSPALCSLASASFLHSALGRRSGRGRCLSSILAAVPDGIGPAGELLEESADGAKLPGDAWKDMAKVSKSLWPLLMKAAEAEAADGANGTDGAGNVDAFGRAARGLAAWQEALSRGRTWKDEDGANWPAEKSIRSGWQDLLVGKGLPQLVRRYPKLVDPLLASLLETLEEFHNQNQQEQEQEQGQSSEAGGGEEGEGGEESGAQAEEDPQDESGGEGGEQDSSDRGEEERAQSPQQGKAQRREDRAEQLLGQLAEKWGSAATAINAADEAFGEGAGSSMAEGFSVNGGAQWHDSSWKELKSLAQILRKSPELREIIRKLGRRSAVRGPLHKLPEEIFKEGGPDGVIRSPAAPAEASGVCLSGSWDTMLPSEAQLLAAKMPMLRSLHHARRIEQSLLCYDRSAWLEDSAKTTGRFEMRPLGQAGPLIVCLDTSGSMMGEREVLSKALVVECMRQAHRQNRSCYLYAFSGMGDLKELELDMTESGLRKVLDFLRCSFGGGTYLEDALSASAQRLQEDAWRNADLLIVTDGELDVQTEDEAPISRARSEFGTKVVGLVLAHSGGPAMERLCDELYITGDVGRFRGDSAQAFPKLKLVTPKKESLVAER